jgi:CHAT domain-containing protein
MVVGARSLLVSLWKVKGGVATSELMSEFYRQLVHGQSRLTALRAAQRHVRGRDEWRHQRNRAAFVLIGGTGPLVVD